jgi:hypothetical protein
MGRSKIHLLMRHLQAGPHRALAFRRSGDLSGAVFEDAKVIKRFGGCRRI